MNILPILMCRNEERWIERVLTPLANVFPRVLVADTGSTDSTIEQILKVPKVQLIRYPNSTMAEVGLIRGALQRFAKELGAIQTFMCDADELYPTSYLQYIYDNPMPEGKICGFTTGLDVAELPNGEIWKFDSGASRDAVYSVDTTWHGSYPFEGHSSFQTDRPELNYYWPSLLPNHHYYHLHQTRRSSKDAEVYLRLEKKYKFSMLDRPDKKPVEFWLKNERDYRDE